MSQHQGNEIWQAIHGLAADYLCIHEWSVLASAGDADRLNHQPSFSSHFFRKQPYSPAMRFPEANLNLRPGPAKDFATTHWSLVLRAGDTDVATAQLALETLCRAYWRPLHSFVCRMGLNETDAQDLTQEFFRRFLEKNYITAARRERGRFRSFLLIALKHFLTQEWRKQRTAKRGGQHFFISWDTDTAASGYPLEDNSELTPAQVYDQRWALVLFERALDRLREEFVAEGKAREYEQMKQFLSAEGNESVYTMVADKLGAKPATVAVAVHRLRKRYGALVRAEIAATVASPTDVEEELHYLLALVSG